MLNFIRYFLITFIFTLFHPAFSQTADELKRFMETYDKLKVDQQANEIVKKGIESEKDPKEQPVRLLVNPSDISKYYIEKMNVIQKEIALLNNLIVLSDSLKPISDFGYNYFFLRDSIQYIDNIKITSNYILGFGDEIIISLWGQAEQHEKKFIQRDGTIYIEDVGLLYLSGKNLSDAKKYISNRFSKVYSTLNTKPQTTFIDVSIGKIKNINITVAGNVNMPGNYIVNPSISLINLLVLSGGINESGSLRNINIMRNNKIIDSVDLYPLISGLSSINNFIFYDNDIVVIPPKGGSVAITGAVRKPAYFEIKNDNIESLLSFAGGVTRHAKSEAYIYRNENYNLYIKDSNFQNNFLQNGDSLVVPIKNNNPKFISVSIDRRDVIDIPWIENLSYSSIFNSVNISVNNIKKIELTRSIQDSKYERYILQNYDVGEFDFLPFDYVSIQLINSYKKMKTITVKGLVGSPGVYPLMGERQTLNSLLNRAGGLDPSIDISNVVVKRDTSQFGSKNGNLILTPGDSVFANPFIGTIDLKGEIHNPGKIEWSKSRTAKDYLNLAGGLTSYGDKKHIVYITPYGEALKISKNSNIELSPGGKIIVSQKPLSELEKNPDLFSRITSLISSFLTIAILANSTSGN